MKLANDGNGDVPILAEMRPGEQDSDWYLMVGIRLFGAGMTPKRLQFYEEKFGSAKAVEKVGTVDVRVTASHLLIHLFSRCSPAELDSYQTQCPVVTI